jgi:hypothetical protein
MSSLVWLTLMSSRPSGMALRAGLWFTISGEEAVGAAFSLAEASIAAGGGRTAPPISPSEAPKRALWVGGTSKKCHLCHLATMANNNNVGEVIENSDEEFMAVAGRNFKRRTRPPKDHFKKILEVSCPHHPYPVKHKLMDCTTMKKFMSSAGTPPSDDEPIRHPRGGGMALREAEVATITD